MSNSRIRAPGAWTALSVITHGEVEAFDAAQARSIDGAGGGAYAPSAAIVIGQAGVTLTGVNHTVSSVGTPGRMTWLTGSELRGNSGSILTWHGDATFDTGGVTFSRGFTANDECDFSALVSITGTGSINLASGATLGAQVGSTASFLGVLNYSGTAGTFSGPLTVSSAISRSGTTTYTGSGPHEAGTCHVGGARHYDSGSTLSCDLGSTCSLLGTVSIGSAATATCAAPFVMTGAGRIRIRTTTGADADHTYGVSSADLVFVAGVTAPRTYTVTSTGAADGDQIQVTGTYSGSTVTLVDDFASTIHVLQDGSGNLRGCTLTFIGGSWKITGRDFNP